VHFKTEGGGAQAAQLAELAADSGVDENEFVARVSTASTAAQGQTMGLAFDTSKITIFDADTGANLTIAPSGSNGQAPESPVAPAPRHRRPACRVIDVLAKVGAHPAASTSPGPGSSRNPTKPV